jgi:hypothetical protein
MLFTSYFTRAGYHPKSLSISRYAPSDFKGGAYPALAPSQELLLDYKRGVVDDVEYTRRFMGQLSLLDPHKVVNDIPPGSILLCYEGSRHFCHRHIVAVWLEQHTGTLVQEITSFDVEKFITMAKRQETI